MASKATFKSYIDFDPLEEMMNGNEVPPKPHADPTPSLLPGEIVLAQAACVIKYSLFSDQKKGLNGTLFCTNFRVAYVTSVEEDTEPDWKRNKLLAENDIPLSSIDSLYQISKGKRKKLLPGVKVSKRPKILEIHCKDFRVQVYFLKFADKSKTMVLVSEILKAAYPDTEKSLFGFSYKGDKENRAPDRSFQIPGDWEMELRRLGADQWKTVQINQTFNLSLVLPEVIVVPKSARSPDLKRAAAQFVDGRLPTWSYTLPNQASLVRMACLIPESEFAVLEEELIECIKKTNSGRLQIIDLARQCPDLQELNNALNKLRDICLPLSSKELRQTDENWLSGLESSRWISFVSQCLELSLEIANTMKKGTSVIIREPGAADYCCVISSLVELILDPYYRTTDGFEALIRKEWISMGHRFLSRLGLTLNSGNDSEVSPVFQLFLDCVWQLLNQFPGSFELSETYLTVLSDSTHLGLFSEFMFDSLYQSSRWARECGKYNKGKFLSVWNWSVQFSDKFQTLFRNPLYEMDTGSVANSLAPDFAIHLLGFWSQCYLRWLSPVAIRNGGTPSLFLAQCRLVQEIRQLQDEVVELENRPELRTNRKRQDLFLNFNSTSSRQSSLDVLTSSFPFTPLSPKEELMAITARTVDSLDDSTSQQEFSVSYSESDCSVLDD